MMRLEWLDIVLVLALIGILIFSGYTLYLHREPERPGLQIPIDFLDDSKPKVQPSKPNLSAQTKESAKSFDHPIIRLNDSDLASAFGDPLFRDVFHDRANLLVALRTDKGMEYLTIRLASGNYVGIEYRLYSNAVRVDATQESFRRLITAGQEHDYDVIRSLIRHDVHLNDDVIRQRLDDALEVY